MYGDEIFDLATIRLNYLTGMFFIDVLSSFPIEVACPPLPHLARLVNVLKIVRLRRLTIIISKLNVDSEVRAIYRITYLILMLVLLIHCVGSGWHLMMKQT